jgi:two-component system nitrogen regulation sensor histidine kinase GlnL
MLDSLSTAVVELDDRGCVQNMNTAAEHCLATGRERTHGVPFQDIEGIPEALSEAISATTNEQHGRHLRECKLAGGWFDCTIQPVAGQHMLLEFYDLKWQQQQSKLQQREMQTGMMDLLRRNLGHEIRNPLGGIRGAAQMMAAELNGRELGTLAELIMREVDRIDELLARFGQPELERHPVDIHYILQETTDLLRLESAESVKIIQDYDPSIPTISADTSALRQLFLNLLLNAFQAGASEIRIRSRVDYDSALLQPGVSSVLRLDVEDNGCGVPESLRNMLFLPLVTGRRDGTGLGLALAQQIAAAHEGLLSYAPLEPGSCFTLKLPLERNRD